MRLLMIFSVLISSALAHAQAGCFVQQGHECQAKPGIVEGQTWSLDATITLPNVNHEPGAGWVSFVDGRAVPSTPQAGSYCAVNNTAGKLPSELVRGNTAILPATKSPFMVTEISWYVGTVFLEGKTAGGNTLGLVIYCAEAASGKENTSLQAIQKHLDGILTLKK